MKNIFKIIGVLALGTILFSSCKKEENQVVFEGGTAPVLSATSTGPFVLNIANKTDYLLTFNWTNPDYHFNAGISSQNVNYVLQVDTTGSNFTNPNLKEIAIASDLSKPMTVGELNGAVLDLGLLHNQMHQVEFRLKSYIGLNAGVLYSNVVKMNITPYLDTKYPVPAALFIVGNATPGDWNNPVPVPSQQFEMTNAYTFQLDLNINPNNSYLFLPVNGSWDQKYGFDGNNNENNVNGDNFKPGGGDMKAPGTSGLHRITVDFKTGKWTIVKL